MFHPGLLDARHGAELCNALADEERDNLSDHPAGLIELDDTELENVSGGAVNPTIHYLQRHGC